jgi:hypothetical protein
MSMSLLSASSSASTQLTLGLKVRRRLSTEMQALLVFLRFGTMSSDDAIWLPLTEIFKRTGIRPSTQLKVYARWKRRGFIIQNEKPKGRRQSLTQEQIDWLVARDTLQSMTHLSLR